MHALWIVSGIVIWALHFGALYGFTALACARGHPNVIPPLIVSASLVAAVLASAVAVKGFHRRSGFIDWMTAGIAAFALIAVVYEATAGLLAPPCE